MHVAAAITGGFAALATLTAACGDNRPAATPDAAPDLTPRELADDEQPYALAADCAALQTWVFDRRLTRVAAASAREAWVVSEAELYHLGPGGSIELEPLDNVNDAWRCPGVTWAVGSAGLVARKPDGGAWQRLDLGLPAGFEGDIVDGGVGCDGDVWVGAGLAVHVHDGTSWRAIPTEPTYFDPDNPDAGKLEHDAARVRGAGINRVATANYGETLAYFPERDAFGVVAGTDDLVSDAVVFRDGTGATLYHGHALGFDRDADHDDGDSPLAGVRASRRADDDIWISLNTVVRHFDGATVTDEPTPGFFGDVDARFDAIWAVGHNGAAVRTEAGWCHVAVAPNKP